MIRLTTGAPVIVKDDEWVAQQQFTERYCVVFKDFVDGSIPERVPRMFEAMAELTGSETPWETAPAR